MSRRFSLQLAVLGWSLSGWSVTGIFVARNQDKGTFVHQETSQGSSSSFPSSSDGAAKKDPMEHPALSSLAGGTAVLLRGESTNGVSQKAPPQEPPQLMDGSSLAGINAQRFPGKANNIFDNANNGALDKHASQVHAGMTAASNGLKMMMMISMALTVGLTICCILMCCDLSFPFKCGLCILTLVFGVVIYLFL